MQYLNFYVHFMSKLERLLGHEVTAHAKIKF